MSVDSTLDTAFTTLLGKFPRGGGSNAVTGGTLVPIAGSGPVTINITFSGMGGGLPGSGMAGVVEIPGALTIVRVHMFAGDEDIRPVPVTAAVSLRRTSEGSFGSSTAIYGSTMPALSGDASTSIDVSGWTQDYTIGDTILYRLDSFSGAATWLTLTMQMRPNATSVPT